MTRYFAVVLVVASCGLALRSEAIFSGFFADDYAQLGMLEGRYPLQRSRFDLYTFSDGSLREGQTLIDSGFYPWFTDPHLQLSMLRPLASAMIWLDHAVFGSAPLGYHLHSAVWWAALIAALALLYRRLMPAPIALLSLALFAVDEAHAIILSWVANRCALVCVCLAVLSFSLHIRQQEAAPANKTRSWLVASLFALAFGFGEYALCVLAYVLAHDWLCCAGPVRARARRLWPFLVPPVIFLAARSLLGFTARHSGMYVDPVSEPLKFAAAFGQRLPVLASDLLLAMRGESWTFGNVPSVWRYLDGSFLPGDGFARVEAWRAIQVALGLGACCLFALLCRWIWTRTTNVHYRWLGLGSALSLLPVVGSFPSSRLLLVPLIGFGPLLAALLFEGLARARGLFASGEKVRAIGLATLAAVSCGYHLVIPIWLTRDVMRGVEYGGRASLHAVLNLAGPDEQLPKQNIILLGASSGDTGMYLPLTRGLYGKTTPAGCYTLSLTPAPYALFRVADNAFTIDFRKPAAMLRTAGEQLLRSPDRPFALHQAVETRLFRVMILAVENGWPRRFLVRFKQPLDHPSLRFMLTTPAGIRDFALPPVGRAVQVPAPSLPAGQGQAR